MTKQPDENEYVKCTLNMHLKYALTDYGTGTLLASALLKSAYSADNFNVRTLFKAYHLLSVSSQHRITRAQKYLSKGEIVM